MTMKRRTLSLALALFLVLAFVPALTTPALAMGDTFAMVSAGSLHTMAIKSDGSLWAWGWNTEYQLGDGTGGGQDDYRLSPVKIMDDVASVSAAYDKTAAIKTDGSLWVWGYCRVHSFKSSGYGEPPDYYRLPEKIMEDVASVSMGQFHTMAIKTDGSLWGWGFNGFGGLGDGTGETGATVRYKPIKIMDGVAAVSVGDYYSLIIKTDGTLWGCGYNKYGNLADGTASETDENGHWIGDAKRYYSPIKIMDNVVSVSAGNCHATAIKTDGSLWAWGRNHAGALGDGTASSWDQNSRSRINNDKYYPIKIMDNVASVSADNFQTMAIKTDGSLWGWGLNDDGQLGDGTHTERHSPIKIMDNVAAVSTGLNHTMAIKTDGSLWGWGSNWVGQLGDGMGGYLEGNDDDESDVVTPIKIMDGVKLPTGAAIPTPTTPSADNPSSWAQADVTTAITAGLVPSSLQSKYTQATTRAEFCALAVALYEKVTGGAITERTTFKDTSDVNVQKMGALGVVTGVGNGNFAPDQKLTREQAATMLSRLANAIEKPLASSAAAFADNGSISSWAIEGVGQVQAAGIMGGVGNNTFSPKTDYTREQSIVTILRLFNVVK